MTQNQRRLYEVLFHIPIGESGVNYADAGNEEMEAWGPASLKLAADRSFLIADTVTNRILVFSFDGQLRKTISVSAATGITDIAFDGQNLFALDGAAVTPTITILTSDRQPERQLDLPKDLSLQEVTGISLGTDGRLLVELQWGAFSYALETGVLMDTGPAKEPEIRIQRSLTKETIGSRAIITAGDSSSRIELDNASSSVHLISTLSNGDLLFLVEECVSTPEIVVDQTVRHYGADGTLKRVARVPLQERYTFVAHGVVISPDGQAYALITRPDGADVVRLIFSQELEPILPKTFPAGSKMDSSAILGDPAPTREQMIESARKYVDNKVFLNGTNLDGFCLGRKKPRYLGTTPKLYASVAYDWGGWDTVDKYNEYMAQGFQAGDIGSTSVEDCSKGVDCSGFVTRCWGITNQKYGTWTLPEISTPITKEELLPGDIINRPGRHVVMFGEWHDPGVELWLWEATTSPDGVDRVVHKLWTWSRFQTINPPYTPRRYNKLL